MTPAPHRPAEPVPLLGRYRMEAALTQQELARAAGMSVRALRNLERGRVRSPHVRSVRRLAAALELSAEDRDLLWASFTAGLPAGDGGTLRIGILGPLALHRGDDQVELSAPRQRSLLGLMAVQPNQTVSHDEIVDVLWGDEPPPTCSTLVHVTIGRLRRLLEPAAPARIVTLPGRGYRLEVTGDQLDLARFDELVARGRRARVDGDLGLACDLLAEAVRCWHGPLLADSDLRLRQHPAAVATCRRRVAAALAYADLALDLDRHDDAAEPLRALAQVESLHEGLCARLMLILAAGGEHAAALRLYGGMRERLAEELAVVPGAELQAAHVRLLRHRLRAAGPAGRGGSGRGTAVLTAGSGRPAQLPADVAAFTGRAVELRWLDERLAESGPGNGSRTAVTIAVVTGAPGVGKTALAVHWAHRVRGSFPGGQLFADLHGDAHRPPVPPIRVLTRFLHALGVPAERAPADLDEASCLYRTLLADERVLVVLDNARTEEQVRPLLPGGPGCLVLVTGRARLAGAVARDGARRLTLGRSPRTTPGPCCPALSATTGSGPNRTRPATSPGSGGTCH